MYDFKLKEKMLPERSFITSRKCIDQIAAADSDLKSMIHINGTYIKLQPNRELLQCLADCTDFGKITSRMVKPKHNVDPNKKVIIQGQSKYNVRTDTDKSICSITGMCETSKGDLVIADFTNCSVKLLNNAYKVIDQLQLPTNPRHMCNISSIEVAVIVSKIYAEHDDALNGAHILRVDNGKIAKIKFLKMLHVCLGIAHHNASLFVTCGTVLYQYTIDRRLIKKLNKDASGQYIGNVRVHFTFSIISTALLIP
ncbi:hypothetical protein DPMN_039675 [Dreissena polymorpha]|uniref:Uncharacterized protein n=1 Tax=Dreissena polymorpha TaxID=45954 RepID=A0A9D4CVP8_DREPO|nr:hypothetical protein DPMN_039675 [Dreissena polymorpha]